MATAVAANTDNIGVQMRLQKIKNAQCLADNRRQQQITIAEAKTTAQVEKLKGKLLKKQKEYDKIQYLINANTEGSRVRRIGIGRAFAMATAKPSKPGSAAEAPSIIPEGESRAMIYARLETKRRVKESEISKLHLQLIALKVLEEEPAQAPQRGLGRKHLSSSYLSLRKPSIMQHASVRKLQFACVRTIEEHTESTVGDTSMSSLTDSW